MTLTDRVARLEALVAQQPQLERDLEVIRLQLSRAEGKLDNGTNDVRSELRIVEQRVQRSERRLLRVLGIRPTG